MTDKIGVFPIRLSVKGDGTSAYAKLAIIPPKSKCVVFSIDGSFAASGKDSKKILIKKSWDNYLFMALIIWLTLMVNKGSFYSLNGAGDSFLFFIKMYNWAYLGHIRP